MPRTPSYGGGTSNMTMSSEWSARTRSMSPACTASAQLSISVRICCSLSVMPCGLPRASKLTGASVTHGVAKALGVVRRAVVLQRSRREVDLVAKRRLPLERRLGQPEARVRVYLLGRPGQRVDVAPQRLLVRAREEALVHGAAVEDDARDRRRDPVDVLLTGRPLLLLVLAAGAQQGDDAEQRDQRRRPPGGARRAAGCLSRRRAFR